MTTLEPKFSLGQKVCYMATKTVCEECAHCGSWLEKDVPTEEITSTVVLIDTDWLTSTTCKRMYKLENGRWMQEEGLKAA